MKLHFRYSSEYKNNNKFIQHLCQFIADDLSSNVYNLIKSTTTFYMWVEGTGFSFLEKDEFENKEKIYLCSAESYDFGFDIE